MALNLRSIPKRSFRFSPFRISFWILWFFALVGVGGCSHRKIPSVEATISKTSGVFVHDVERKVDIGELMPFMRRASWTDSFLFWKTSVDVLLDGGRKVRFERLAPMFRIDGVEGTFLIKEEDSAAYEKLRNKIVLGYLPSNQ